ncbi:leucyl aminopeptidase family protein [Methylocystis bryophila]|uniref:Leucyl aminopeptidase n=1 Tax=Methylocystis bryophila TaxID=655015 RepID=A0A1W6MQU5_9HYPH|nr:leucyl aminopeptidase family protein [Methylocystis bryophila]ARN79980.1 leucyl aminopeptidase [Methylocystis bryophila]BDV39886.1 aminopeptidase [Methylocystis bryophila]
MADAAHFAENEESAIPIDCVDKESFAQYLEGLPPPMRAYVGAAGFEPKPGALLLPPSPEGALARVLFGVESPGARRLDPFLAGKLTALPPGVYAFERAPRDPDAAALAFLLSSYQFLRYRAKPAAAPRLRAPKGVDALRLERIAAAVAMGRDLINTPANDMGPQALTDAALAIAERQGVAPRVVIGDDLLRENLPLIHAVGRAAAEAPRLVEFSCGPADGLKVTLVGKGVCYDTGGLDIKPSSAMALMKKDMGGSAVALSLAEMLLSVDLPLRLRVILPIVENSVSAASFRTGDVYKSRKGLSVEIGNTDAEGRLILADALALASEDEPDLLFDFATLTGAARVALGPELPPFYTRSDALAEEIARFGASANDPVWRLPLWEAYQSGLDSKIADVSSTTSHGFAGSITAALFLSRFVADPQRWAHFDVYCWNPSTKPGRPEGGEIQAARLLYDLIEARVATRSATR